MSSLQTIPAVCKHSSNVILNEIHEYQLKPCSTRLVTWDELGFPTNWTHIQPTRVVWQELFADGNNGSEWIQFAEKSVCVDIDDAEGATSLLRYWLQQLFVNVPIILMDEIASRPFVCRLYWLAIFPLSCKYI